MSRVLIIGSGANAPVVSALVAAASRPVVAIVQNLEAYHPPAPPILRRELFFSNESNGPTACNFEKPKPYKKSSRPFYLDAPRRRKRK